MRPFDGITVFTLGHAVAAHFASWQLAHLGPRVIETYVLAFVILPETYELLDLEWS